MTECNERMLDWALNNHINGAMLCFIYVNSITYHKLLLVKDCVTCTCCGRYVKCIYYHLSIVL